MAGTTVYLDHNATTPLDKRVVEAMLPYLREHHGNPSSSHAWGRRSRQAVETAREQAAALLGAQPAEIVFTSGGTESNNHAILGLAAARREGVGAAGHLVTTSVEHPAVGQVCRHLAGQGHAVTELPVAANGLVDVEQLAASLRPDTLLVSVMHANNEVGVIQPVPAVADRARAQGIAVHTDAAQSVGKIPVNVDALGVDLLSLAGHKLYAPKGVGLLYIRSGRRLANLMHGAGHENGRRPGTENVAAIVGLGQACELAAAEVAAEMLRLADLRDDLQAALLARFPTATVHGRDAPRLPNTLSIGFADVASDAIMAAMPEVGVSAGAACHADGVTVSHVLRAMNVPGRYARGTLRISLGRTTTSADVDRGLAAIERAVLAAGGGAGAVNPASD